MGTGVYVNQHGGEGGPALVYAVQFKMQTT